MKLNLSPKTAGLAAVGLSLIAARTTCGEEIKLSALQPAAQFRKQILTDQYYCASKLFGQGKQAKKILAEAFAFQNKHEQRSRRSRGCFDKPLDSCHVSAVFDLDAQRRR